MDRNPKLLVLEPVKTYASKENVIKAVNKRIQNPNLRYFIYPTADGRFFPVFIGVEAVQSGIHFHFNVVG